jgi:3-oxoadipate enol-lactonase
MARTLSGFAEVINGRLFYQSAGSGDVLVLIHGNTGDHRHWDVQFDFFSKYFRVVRYDVRGFGQSSLPIEDKPYTDHEDLGALLDQLDIQNAHIAGWSMGSAIAIDFCLAFPHRTKSLSLVGPWVYGYSSPAQQAMNADFEEIDAVIAEKGLGAAVDAWMNAPFFSATIVDPAAGEQFRKIANNYSFWVFTHRSPLQVLKPIAAGRVSKIQVPTLILTAEQDIPACLEIADLLDKSLPDSRKITLDETGHLLHIEKPEIFNQHLADFIMTIN